MPVVWLWLATVLCWTEILWCHDSRVREFEVDARVRQLSHWSGESAAPPGQVLNDSTSSTVCASLHPWLHSLAPLGPRGFVWGNDWGCRWIISRVRESGMSESDRCAGGLAKRACDAGADLSIRCSSCAPCDGNASHRNACEIGV